jgi:hypothetical protein
MFKVALAFLCLWDTDGALFSSVLLPSKFGLHWTNDFCFPLISSGYICPVYFLVKLGWKPIRITLCDSVVCFFGKFLSGDMVRSQPLKCCSVWRLSKHIFLGEYEKHDKIALFWDFWFSHECQTSKVKTGRNPLLWLAVAFRGQGQV